MKQRSKTNNSDQSDKDHLPQKLSKNCPRNINHFNQHHFTYPLIL